MKFALAMLSAAFATASATSAGLPIFGQPKMANKKPTKTKDITPSGSIKAESKMGRSLLSQARKLDENNNDEEFEFTWVAGYSLKFQGCHHISQWNEEADGEDEPFIQTKRLVRFRLCPSDTCTYEDAGGCDEGYGDYIIDMNIFLEAYWNDKLEYCEIFVQTDCDCNDDDKDDNFNEEYCEYDCFMDNKMDWCVDENPYDNGNDNNNDEYEEMEPEQYMECAQFDIPDNNRRQLARQLDQNEVEYFIGPYCSDQGGSVFLGVFTDEFCTNFADDVYGDGESSHTDFYYKVTGHQLPYATESLIDMECIQCKEWQEQDDNGNDGQDEDEVKEMCEEMYAQAGKCESNIQNAYLSYPNENACNYIEGIKIVRKDGIVVQGSSAKSTTATIFIALFAVAFVLLGAYVYYLKTKLDRAKINLSE